MGEYLDGDMTIYSFLGLTLGSAIGYFLAVYLWYIGIII